MPGMTPPGCVAAGTAAAVAASLRLGGHSGDHWSMQWVTTCGVARKRLPPSSSLGLVRRITRVWKKARAPLGSCSCSTAYTRTCASTTGRYAKKEASQTWKRK